MHRASDFYVHSFEQGERAPRNGGRTSEGPFLATYPEYRSDDASPIAKPLIP